MLFDFHTHGEDREAATRAVIDKWWELNAWAAGAARENPRRISSLAGWTGERMVACIRAIGADRVVYGANHPIVDGVRFRETFDALDLSDEERELIGWRNAARILKLADA